jgi:glutamyl-tRNA(Gln) amidotransferase subunit E
VIACLTTLPNIVHSDSPSETLASSEWQTLKKALGASGGDTLVVVWGPPQDAMTGAAEVVIRAREATIGIPSETRQALRDGTNGFERILPGPDRMYPDTDLPPHRVSEEQRSRIKATLPRPFWETERWYHELGIPEDLVTPLALSPFTGLFETAVKEWQIPPTPAAVLLIQLPKRVAKKTGRAAQFSVETMKEILLAHKDSLLPRGAFLEVLLDIAAGNAFSRDSLPGRCSIDELGTIITQTAIEVSTMSLRHPEQAATVHMGAVMNRVRRRIEGGLVAQAMNYTPREARP